MERDGAMGLIVQMTAKWQHLMTGSVKQLLLVLCPPAPSLHQHQPPSPQPLLHLLPPQYLLHLGVFKTVHGMNQAARLTVHLMERAGAMDYLAIPKERLWPGMTGTAKTQKLAALAWMANGTQQAVRLAEDQMEKGGVMAFIVHIVAV